MRRWAEAHERVDGERRAESGLAVLAGKPDVAEPVLRTARLIEQAVQDLVLPCPKDDQLAAFRPERVAAQVLDEAARLPAAVMP